MVERSLGNKAQTAGIMADLEPRRREHSPDASLTDNLPGRRVGEGAYVSGALQSTSSVPSLNRSDDEVSWRENSLDAVERAPIAREVQGSPEMDQQAMSTPLPESPEVNSPIESQSPYESSTADSQKDTQDYFSLICSLSPFMPQLRKVRKTGESHNRASVRLFDYTLDTLKGSRHYSIDDTQEPPTILFVQGSFHVPKGY